MPVATDYAQEVYKRRCNNRITYEELSAEYDVPLSSLQRAVYNYRTENDLPHERDVRQGNDLQDTIDQYQPPKGASLKRLDAIMAACNTRWQSVKAGLRARGGLATAAFITDIHLPYQDNTALALAAQIVEAANPDIVTGWSDSLDLPKQSRWADVASAYASHWHDDFGNVVEAHGKLLAIFRDAAPNAAMPALLDNHGKRFFVWTRERAAKISDYVFAQFLEEVSEHGLLWLGNHRPAETAPIYLHLSDGLQFTHGHKAKTSVEATIRSYLQEWHDKTTVFGHIHKAGWVSHRLPDRAIHGVSVPCLCDLQPHYSDGWQNWQQGMAIIHYDPNGTVVHPEMIVFDRDRNHLVGYWQGTEYRERLPRKTISETGVF